MPNGNRLAIFLEKTSLAPTPRSAFLACNLNKTNATKPERLLYVLASLFYTVFIVRSEFTVLGKPMFCLFDDAMISMRYARNLASGSGLCWNSGQPPIEGISNLLWTLWMAVIHLLPLPDGLMSLPVMISGAVLLLLNMFVTGKLADEITGGLQGPRLIAVGLTGLCYSLAYWTLLGMEVGLLTLFTSLLVLSALRWRKAPHSRYLIIFLLIEVLAVLTRPDAVVPIGVTGLFFALPFRHRRDVWALAAIVAAGAITTGGLTAFRLAYFGDPLPNTYYLKVYGIPLGMRLERGLTVLATTSIQNLFLPIVLMAIGVGIDVRRKRLRHGVALLATLFTAQCAYSAYVGGDAWEYFRIPNRYLSIAFPGLFILTGWTTIRLVRWAMIRRHRVAQSPLFWPMRRPGWVLALVWVTGNLAPIIHWTIDNTYQHSEMVGWTRLGVLLRETTSEDTTIAVTWAGAVPYFSRRPSIDLLGKSDPIIAHQLPVPTARFVPGHNKYNMKYSFGELKPDLIVHLFYITPEQGRWIFAQGYEILPNAILAREPTRNKYDLERISADWNKDEELERAVHAHSLDTNG